MMNIKITDLPEKFQRQARAQLGMTMAAGVATAHTMAPPTPRAASGPTKTELEYAKLYLAGKDALYEAITFRMANGHRYTPDWIYYEAGKLHAVEVKGGYRLGSYQRAKLAFDQARVEFPWINWIWAEKTKNGWEAE